MSSPQILAISLRMPEKTFESEIQNAASNRSSTMKYAGKHLQMRLSGKEMLKVTISNENDSAQFSFVAERDTAKGELVFTPFKLRSMDETFFTSQYDDDSIPDTDEDPAVFVFNFLRDECMKRQGTFAYVTTNGSMQIIREGQTKRVVGIALVDTENHVYSCTDAKRVAGESDDSGPSFTIQTPINVWLGQNREVANAINAMQDIGDKMNYIGQWLIQARLDDDIDQEEFMDIFRQAGIFGFTNPSVLRIYKLLT